MFVMVVNDSPFGLIGMRAFAVFRFHDGSDSFLNVSEDYIQINCLSQHFSKFAMGINI